MASTSDDFISSLMEQLNSPPKASLQILGTHVADDQPGVIDFDLWIDCTKVAVIRSGQLVTANASGRRSWEDSSAQDGSGFREIVAGWLRESPDRPSWTLHKSASIPDGDFTAFKSHIERLARSIAYGGSVEVVFHTPSIEQDALPEQHDAQIRAAWSFECPFTPADQVWNQAVTNAMVDRKKGTISPSHESGPSHGMSPFRRAIRRGGTSRVV
ncbi:hypothetical protein BP00DRAFT_422142 [Aspergillus indologenus CBS 114.80]|uniref:Uncharacterized protein n=1 Tax=Aspergillus indologenus CBS 114.80 TaxID=1450541 RepID=A0A2V5IGB5_9EURO|nr:hypothetical protein BP00DRAFT_422142 [Aspergillus indologenus CBS 114.80]